jgi:hypothetical protein
VEQEPVRGPWFDVQYFEVPLLLPTIVPVVLPSFLPFPVVVPFVVPRMVPVAIGVASPAKDPAVEQRWTPVPLEVVLDQTDAPAAATTNGAPEFPLTIEGINKVAEIVTLHNVSSEPVDLAGWKMLSVLGEQRHPGLEGTLAPGEMRSFANLGGKIWRDDAGDDGALYAPDGALVSYWIDEG